MEIEDVKKILKDHKRRIENLEKIFENKKNINLENPSLGISDVQEDQLTILKFNGEKVSDKVKNISLLALLEYREKMNIDNLLSSEIRRNVAVNGVPIENFATYLNKLTPRYIIRIGKPKSSNTKYRLTHFGEAEAKGIRENLLEDEKK